MAKRLPFLARLVQLFAKRRSMFTYAVALNRDGTRTLTVFEGRQAASIELSPEWAVELAALLAGPAHRAGAACVDPRVFRKRKVRIVFKGPDRSRRVREREDVACQP